METFAEILRRKMKELGFTEQKVYSEFLDVPPSTLSRYINGQGPMYEHLLKITNKLDLTLFVDNTIPKQKWRGDPIEQMQRLMLAESVPGEVVECLAESIKATIAKYSGRKDSGSAVTKG
jgi:transcriptional regulator with XRE-family HTH domain